MNKLLLTTLSFFFLFSCSSSDNDSEDNTSKEVAVDYHFGISSVQDSESDEERKFEIEIDGEKFNGTAPYEFNKVKKTTLKKTHIKFNLNSSTETNIVYELRINDFPYSKYLGRGHFKK